MTRLLIVNQKLNKRTPSHKKLQNKKKKNNNNKNHKTTEMMLKKKQKKIRELIKTGKYSWSTRNGIPRNARRYTY